MQYHLFSNLPFVFSLYSRWKFEKFDAYGSNNTLDIPFLYSTEVFDEDIEHHVKCKFVLVGLQHISYFYYSGLRLFTRSSGDRKTDTINECY